MFNFDKADPETTLSKLIKILITLLIAGTFFACGSPQQAKQAIQEEPELPFNGELSQPAESEICLENLCINTFTEDNALTLKKYFEGNPRWEVLYERNKVYAIRKEKENGTYITSLNGFYSDFADTVGAYQTRVIVSFGQYYGFGNNEDCITFTDAQGKNLRLIIESEHSGTPGNSSCLIIKGKQINIEIYEQAKHLQRRFTSKTIEELNREFTDVLSYEKDIRRDGVMPVMAYYPFRPDSTYFNILDGMQPGIYIVQAGLQTDKEGDAYVKVFEIKSNEQLSADRIRPRTTRAIGWSANGKTVFQYESELTVYEGDWEHLYEARFEIWFNEKNGPEKKLAEKSRMINGWER
jgi:hypothetical protein